MCKNQFGCRVRLISTAIIAGASLAVPALGQEQRNPFLDVRDALLTDPLDGANFNGPDRGGPDTLHGEVADHWFTGYRPLDLYSNPPVDRWLEVGVPKWQGGTTTVQPISPELPKWTTGLNNDFNLSNGETIFDASNDPIMHIVPGRFLVGAIMWPHEEYVEQFAAGTLPGGEITDAHKVPIYWLASYYLFIPADYGDFPTSTRERAVILGGNGQDPDDQPNTLPPWMDERLDWQKSYADLTTAHTIANPNTSWMFHAAYRTARRLQVPVMLLTEYPEQVNTWRAKSVNPFYPQGGISGYSAESRVDFPIAWVAAAGRDGVDESDPVRDHPQFMYAATFVRARTFLDGFFNPYVRGTTGWSKWDDIVDHFDLGNTARYMPIDSVIAQGSSKRGHAVWIAGLIDPTIKAIVNNGMAHLRIPQSIRFAQDENAENRNVKLPGNGNDPEFEIVNFRPADDDQLPPTYASPMQGGVNNIAREYRRETNKQGQYYDIYPAFIDRDVMKDDDHQLNELEEIQVLNTQGAQDSFWPRMAWHYWVKDKVFHGKDQYFDWNMYGTHPPFHPEFAEKMQGFADHVWKGRPMPTAEIWDVEYEEPPYYDPSSVDYVPVTVKAVFTINDSWQTDPPDSPDAFDMSLCIAVRPHKTKRSRGVWSDYSSYDLGYRQTPWWEVEPEPGSIQLLSAYPDGSSLPENTIAYEAEFVFDSNPYSQQNPYVLPPSDFDGTHWDAMAGVPPMCHVCFYVRVAVKHTNAIEVGESDDDPSWRVFSSSLFEYLSPWWGSVDVQILNDEEHGIDEDLNF